MSDGFGPIILLKFAHFGKNDGRKGGLGWLRSAPIVAAPPLAAAAALAFALAPRSLAVLLLLADFVALTLAISIALALAVRAARPIALPVAIPIALAVSNVALPVAIAHVALPIAIAVAGVAWRRRPVAAAHRLPLALTRLGSFVADRRDWRKLLLQRSVDRDLCPFPCLSFAVLFLPVSLYSILTSIH